MTSSAYFPKTTRLFSMVGRDARDFLHRLTSVNVRNLQPGEFKPGFFLSSQGKIRAAFRIACAAPDSFLFEIDDGESGRWVKEFLAVIEEFTFAEEFRITEKTGLKNLWIFSQPKARENAYETEGALEFLFGSRDSFGTNWTSVWGSEPSVDLFRASLHSEILDEASFERLRILSLFPRIDREILPESNPLELGLRSAIDDGKGCYPGQEVVEKIISIGSPAKRLALISSDTPIARREKLFLGKKSDESTGSASEVGTASSVSTEEGRGIALALLRKNALEEGKSLQLESGAKGRVEKIARYE